MDDPPLDDPTPDAPPGVDVLVVGGGPVGVAVALVAAHRGLSARVLERSDDVYQLPRAIVMDDEVQRVFQGLGLGEGLAALTTPLRGAEFVDVAGRRIVGIEMPEPVVGPLGQHLLVAYDQPELEAWLRDRAQAAGVDLRLGVTVTAVGQDDARAWADTGGERHTGRWLVAADGAASPTRKALGIEFEDQGFDQEWLVVDLDVTDDEARTSLPDLVQQICDLDRPTTYVPGHGRYRRWEFQLQEGEDPVALAEPATVWRLLDEWVEPHQAVLRRAVVYRFHATVAARFRADRIFLAGDAAHQMPPFLGQGLGAGLRDAANLGWKLEAVAAGRASDRLLDSYKVERRPHSAATVAHAVATGRLIDQFAGRVDSGTPEDAAYGGGRSLPHLIAGLVTGDHPLVGHQVPQPAPGWDDRLGPGWAVLARRPEVVAEAAARLDAAVVLLAPSELADLVEEDGAAVVRPDRNVAAVADSPAALAAAVAELARWFGP